MKLLRLGDKNTETDASKMMRRGACHTISQTVVVSDTDRLPVRVSNTRQSIQLSKPFIAAERLRPEERTENEHLDRDSE